MTTLTAISRFKIVAAAALMLLVAVACTPKVSTVHIISTNDIHATIDSIPLLASLVESYRAQDTAAVVLVDAGDRWTGNPYVDKAEEQGAPIMDLMKALRYDVITFGNHEFDNGVDVLDARLKQSGLNVVLANINTGSTSLTQPQPYTIVEAGGRKIAFLGLVTNSENGHPEGDDQKYEGLTFADPTATAREYSFLADKSDLTVALTHTGFEYDSLMVLSVPYFDLLIGGHTHTVIPQGRTIGQTVVTQTGNKLSYAGVTTVVFDKHGIRSIDNHLVPLKDYAPEPRFAAMVDSIKDNPYMKVVMGKMERSSDLDGLANFITDVARQKAESDFAMYHRGGIRVEGWAMGDVCRDIVYQTEPFGTRMVVVEMSLEQIRQLILNKFNDTKIAKESHRVDLYPSGLSYAIVTDSTGEAVDVIFDLGTTPQKESYSVAVSNYMYNQYNFTHGPLVNDVGLVTDLLFERLGESVVVPDNTPRVIIR